MPPEVPATSRRGRIQRRLRRQRTRAARDAAIGAVLTALLVLVVGGDRGPGNGPSIAVQQGTLTAAPSDATPTAAADSGEQGTADADALFTAAMVGDVMFGRHVEVAAERHGFDALLAEVAPLLDRDYVSANLEQVVSERPQEDLPEADKLIHLASDRRATQALADAGVTTVSLANNHSMDHGIPGLRDTIAALDAAGLAHAGAGETLEAAVEIDYQEHGDLTVATLSFTEVFVEGFIARAFQGGALQADVDTFGPLLQKAALEADLVIAHVHWGEEYDLRVRAVQRELAADMALAGADIIVGTHPHVLLPVERIGDTLVLHSLGNFVFDQGWSRTRESAIARYALGEDGTARIELIPVYIREATPRVVSGMAGVYRRERIFQRLRGDGLEWQREGDRLVAEFDHSSVLREDAPPTGLPDEESPEAGGASG